jgi:phosphatidylglycerol:prolipoprotein diacylglycerol transferase
VHPYLIDVHPELPWFGEVHIALPTYGALVALALVVAWFWVLRRARQRGLPVEPVSTVLFWSLVGGILGAKLGLVVVELPEYLADPGRLLSLEFLRAAGVIWAGLLGGLLALALSARRAGIPIATIGDLVAAPAPLAQAIGRIGCMMAGCCFGGACDLPWAVVYASGEAQARTGVPLGIPLHPAPLYEALWNIAVVVPAVLLIERRQRFRGELVLAYLALYGSGRFFVELFRGDFARGLWFDGLLSTSQLVSMIIVPLALALWWRGRSAAPAPPAELRRES